MDNHYKTFFGLKTEVFRTDLKQNEILKTDELISSSFIEKV